MTRLTVLVALCLAVSCLPGPEPAGTSTSPIIAGADDFPEQYPGVVRISMTGTPDWACSGTLVDATGAVAWVLTAAHCVARFRFAMPYGINRDVLRVSFGAEVATATAYQVATVVVHPRFAMDRLTYPGSLDAWPIGPAHDVALLGIIGLAPEHAATAIPWLAPEDDALAAGDEVVLVGYGWTANGGPLAEVRQHAVATVLDVLPTERLGNEIVVVDERGALAGFADGDSGGAVLVTDGAGELRLAGVISGSNDAGFDPHEGFGHCQRVSALVEGFLEPVLAGDRPAPESCLSCAHRESLRSGECYDALLTNMHYMYPFVLCVSESSLGDCRSEHPAGAAAYDDYWSCLEGPGCSGLCVAAERTVAECRFAFDGVGPCDRCLYESCCGATSACSLDEACSPCVTLNTADPDACAADPLYRELRGCLDESCGEVCEPYLATLPPVEAEEPDGGPPDGGGPDADGPDAGGPDADGPGDGEGGGGCGCRAGGGPAPASPLALLALLWSRRARRR